MKPGKVNELAEKDRMRRIPELDGFRVLLVFIVSWYHIWQQSWLTPRVGSVSLDFLVRAGYMPVDGTILLSGFLLFLPYARHMLLGERMPSVRGFYQRRIARIVPSYVFVTLLMLFAVAIPYKQFRTTGAMVKDVAMHLTFTQTFDRLTYNATPLGGSSWTVAIEMQMYLLFPWIAQLAKKHPAGTMLGMTAISAYARSWFLWSMTEYSMVVNQLISFLDVYALGMACALLYVTLAKRWTELKHRRWWECAATAVLALGIVMFVYVMRDQATSNGYNMIQAGQMARRPALAVALALVMTSLPFCVLPVRFVFGNKLMQWLATISMNYYLLHQNVAVHLKRLRIPYSIFETPNTQGDRTWQYQYTWLCFGVSLLLAITVTQLIEKPCAAGLKHLFAKLDQKRERKKQAKT